MPRVFIAGSITIKRLPTHVEARLDNIRSSGLDVLVGMQAVWTMPCSATFIKPPTRPSPSTAVAIRLGITTVAGHWR